MNRWDDKSEKFSRKPAEGKLELVDQLSVYGIVSNEIVRKEHVTMYIAIFGLELRPVSEFCGQRTEYFCSFKNIRKNYWHACWLNYKGILFQRVISTVNSKY